MREIKTHRTGGVLNEALRIEVDGDKYDVLVKAHGQWGKKFRIEFQGDREYAEDRGGPDGLSEEVLLAILLDHLGATDRYHDANKELNHGAGIAHDRLQEALLWLSTCKNK